MPNYKASLVSFITEFCFDPLANKNDFFLISYKKQIKNSAYDFLYVGSKCEGSTVYLELQVSNIIVNNVDIPVFLKIHMHA